MFIAISVYLHSPKKFNGEDYQNDQKIMTSTGEKE